MTFQSALSLPGEIREEFAARRARWNGSLVRIGWISQHWPYQFQYAKRADDFAVSQDRDVE